MEWIVSILIFLIILWIAYCLYWLFADGHYDCYCRDSFKNACFTDQLVVVTLYIITIAAVIGIAAFIVWLIHFVIYVHE